MRTERVIRGGVVLALVVTAAGSGGCSTMSNTEKGVGLGAAAGAGLGTAVGALTHHPGLGAVAGGLVGAGVGGAVGNNIDRKEEDKRDARQASAIASAQAAQAAQRMGMTDVIKMVQEGHDEQIIITQIRNTGSTFQLTASDLDFLKTNNVPSRVILEMQTARQQPMVVNQPRPVIVREQPTVVYEQPPPVVVVGAPRPYYYYGGGYYRRW
ncbi:MAG: hypothetical protein JWO38_2897 [Gemmataceae bacterium]|nr:hypothetical protein [Gemmataceae bacterium]